jgi:hypothetical protein
MALAISAWETEAAGCPGRFCCVTAADGEAFALMKKGLFAWLDSMWPLRVNVSAGAALRHAQERENIGVNRRTDVDADIAQHVKFFA